MSLEKHSLDSQVALSEKLLAGDGPVAGVLSGFSPRPSQQRMAGIVARVISTSQNVIVEAPSGSGKTLAYLVPIIASNKKVIISTATRYLQNQLYRQDIPLVQRALGSSAKVAVLKGRSNYVCPYYLEKHVHNERALNFQQRAALSDLWHKHRESGLGEIDELAPSFDRALMAYASCSSEECLTKQCPQLSRCPLMLARQRAQRADIVVVNHSLLFSDQLMRREQLGGLLPAVDAVVIDEAHRLADFAQTLVGQRLSSYQLGRFCRDAVEVIQCYAPEQRGALDFLKQLQRVINRLKASGPSLNHFQPSQHRNIVEQLIAAMGRLAACLQRIAERDFSLNEMLIRTRLLQQTLQKITAAEGLCFIESRERSFMLQNIPLNLSSLVGELIAESGCSWIFTSATLSVAGSANRFSAALGLEGTEFQRLKADIDYRKNARLYLPDIPLQPDEPGYINRVVEAAAPAIERVNGRVLFLFTSYKNLQLAAELLRRRGGLALFIQGVAEDYQLIDQFKRSAHGVLLGTGSFWEGLDLSGVPLSMVIIDKLPFASPFETLVNLRANELTRHGVDSFQHYLLPDAVIRLRQGCGRLLRRLSDKGVIMLADPRLQNKAYGPFFMDSLPAIERVNSLAALEAFFQTPAIDAETHT